MIKTIMEYYENMLLLLLSTESTELIVANPEMTRVAKEQMICGHHLTQKYLYVCWKEFIKNSNTDSSYNQECDSFLNCTRCDKCLRTLLAFDLMGVLDKFDKLFDIKYYLKHKDGYVAKVIANRKTNSFYHELYMLMKEKSYAINKKEKLYIINYSILRYFPWVNKPINMFYRIIKRKRN